MTEYDYSPEAVERYMAVQSRVSNWVAKQGVECEKYSSPFQHTPTEADPARFEFYKPKSSRKSNDASKRPSSPRRSKTDHGHDYGHRRDPSSSTSSSQTLVASGSSKRPSPSRSQTVHAFYPTTAVQVVPGPIRSQSMPMPTMANGNHIYLPPGKPGQVYYFVPPHPKGNLPSSPTMVTYVADGPTLPTKKSLPLFKRLFGSLTTSNGRPSSRSSSRTGSSGRSQTRSNDHSWTLVELTDKHDDSLEQPRRSRKSSKPLENGEGKVRRKRGYTH